MTDEQSMSERWYDAYNTNELREFLDALWAATEIVRRAHPEVRWDLPSQPLLWTRIKQNGGMHDRGTWLRIEQVLPGQDYVVIKQRRSDGTDQTFNLTPEQTHELIGWRAH
jgi:hypothetical protein